MKKSCEHCGGNHETESSKSRFCSAKCRVYHSRGAKPIVTNVTVQKIVTDPVTKKHLKRVVTVRSDEVVTMKDVTVTPVTQERFFLDQCPDDRWYLIPEGRRKEWCDWCSSPEELPDWITIVTGGYPSFVTFCCPIEVELGGPEAIREPAQPKPPHKAAVVPDEPNPITSDIQRAFARIRPQRFDSSKPQFKSK